jgi:tRNA(fMet)-specific endonuclease VapC
MEETKVMLDTSGYSALLRGNKRVLELLQEADRIFISPVILGELLSGFMAGSNERKNRAMLDDFLASPRVSLVGLDDETAERYAVIVTHLRSKGTPISTNDLWIAASAMQHGFKVITSDNHFLKVPHIITLFCG